MQATINLPVPFMLKDNPRSPVHLGPVWQFDFVYADTRYKRFKAPTPFNRIYFPNWHNMQEILEDASDYKEIKNRSRYA